MWNFSEKLGICPGCGRPVLSPLCPLDESCLLCVVPWMRYTRVDLCQLSTLSLFSTCKVQRKYVLSEVESYTMAQWFRCSLKRETCICNVYSNYTPSGTEHRNWRTEKGETLGLLIAIKQHGLVLGSAYMGNLRNLLLCVGERDNSVLAAFLHNVPKISPDRDRMLVKIGLCTCIYAFHANA